MAALVLAARAILEKIVKDIAITADIKRIILNLALVKKFLRAIILTIAATIIMARKRIVNIRAILNRALLAPRQALNLEAEATPTIIEIDPRAAINMNLNPALLALARNLDLTGARDIRPVNASPAKNVSVLNIIANTASLVLARPLVRQAPALLAHRLVHLQVPVLVLLARPLAHPVLHGVAAKHPQLYNFKVI